MIINVMTCGRNVTFKEVTQAFITALTQMGHTVKHTYLLHKTLPVPEIDNRGVNVNLYIGVFGNKAVDPNVLNILYNTEQWDSWGCREPIWREILGKMDVTLDMFKNRHPWDRKTIYCPVGWSEAFEIEEGLGSPVKDINIFHIGPFDGRSVDKEIVERSTPWGGYGKNRGKRIARAKTHLILSRRDRYEFPQIRAMFSMCNKVLTLSTHHSDYGIYAPNKHFVLFRPKNFIEISDHWITKNKERQEFVTECYRDIKKNHKFTMYIENALKGVLT